MNKETIGEYLERHGYRYEDVGKIVSIQQEAEKMNLCKDCIHYDVCREIYGDNVIDENTKGCHHFRRNEK